MIDVAALCRQAKAGSYILNALSAEDRNAMLEAIASEIEENKEAILEANRLDLAGYNAKDESFKDRLTLTEARIAQMCEGVRQLIALPDPIGEVVDRWTNRAGLEISKVRAPLGVVAVIYEARPNVTVDVAGLCIKTGNAVVLRGGADAINTNRSLYQSISTAIAKAGYNADCIQFIDDKDRAATYELLKQGKSVDVIIPRGGDKLKETVLANATMPVIASAGGNCHIYVHNSANIEMAVNIIDNAKTQRPSVCNACEQLVIDKAVLPEALPVITERLRGKGVVVKGDKYCREIIPDMPLCGEEEYYEEHLALALTVKAVDNIDEAIAHINAHSTMHSEAIIAEDKAAQAKFAKEIDSGCVYVNASTRFTDGFEFGFGAEIGISTQKLHARGPLGLRQLTSEKYVAIGDGTLRK